MKKILGIRSSPQLHWVGDGFPVRSIFSYRDDAKLFSPFLLLDYAGPMVFEPATHPRGVGEHPHRGFETVTIVYKGEVSHKDSTGKGGTIGTGDVQWMTAGAGILHEEFHSERFTRSGGELEMIQLWVNLPAKDKMTAPNYQAIVKQAIPEVALANKAGSVRVIAGEYEGQKGPANTFTPLLVWDIKLAKGNTHRFTVPDGWNTILIASKGEFVVNEELIDSEADMVVLSAEGDQVVIEAKEDTTLMLLSGEPIDEPVIGYGPFVMNTEQEIREALDDFKQGRFGEMPASS